MAVTYEPVTVLKRSMAKTRGGNEGREREQERREEVGSQRTENF